jgi:hypothetical protein
MGTGTATGAAGSTLEARLEALWARLTPRGWLLAILGFAALVRLLFAHNLQGTDDLNYAFAAWFESEHPFSRPDWAGTHNQHTLRKGLILPTALLYMLFGVSDATTAAWSFACSLGLVALAWAFGRLYFSEPAAAVLAVLAACFPLDIIYSTMMWPTEPRAFFMGLGVYLFLQAEERAAGGERLGPWAYLFAGVAIGVGYLVHMTALFLGLFFVAYGAVFIRRFTPRWLLVGVGLLAVVLLEQALYYPFHGEWMYSFKQTHRAQNLGMGWGFIKNWEGRSALWSEASESAWFWAGPWVMALLNQEFALFFLVGLPVVAWVLWVGGSLRAVALWFLTLFLWLAYGTTDPGGERWAYLGRLPRYYSGVTLPLLIMVTTGAFAVWARGRRWLATLGIAGVALAGLAGAAVDDGRNTGHLETLAEQVEAEPGTTFGIDHTTYSQLRYYLGFAKPPNMVLLTNPVEPGKDHYHDARLRPFDLAGVDVLVHQADNWDLAVRQPENCGSADKTGKLEGACGADGVLSTVRDWPATRIEAPARWTCGVSRLAGPLVPGRVRDHFCRARGLTLYRRPR